MLATNESISVPGHENIETPWGRSRAIYNQGEGIKFYDTDGHGGFKVPPELNAQMPEPARRDDGWYEEDCEWSLVVLKWPHLFTLTQRASATRICKDYFPEAYTALTGLKVKLCESGALRERKFYSDNRENWVTYSAIGEHDTRCPPGMVLCTAAIGGRPSNHALPQGPRLFLVPCSEYDKRTPYGFIIDTKRHRELIG